jgi:ADP-heptose:LPS heptosyltransferase
VERRTGARLVLIGARDDAWIAQEVLDATSASITSVVGQTSIEELIALLQRADLLATGDSGPLHLAVALGKPVVAVYGPTDPEVYGPYNPTAPAEVHRQDLACSPCYTASTTAECPLGDPICMRLVTVRQMVEAAVPLLAG